MRWLDRRLPPVALRCVYCGHAGENGQPDFAHRQSFHYDTRDFALYGCPDCRSLMYFPQVTLLTIDRPFSEAYKADTRLGIKHYLETAYSPEIVVACAAAAFAATPPARWRDCLFVDVGAGVGLASILAAEQYGAETLTIEPSYSGELGREMLGLDIHTVFFEDLPPEVLDRLVGKSCLLHLNSVIEHLHDPAATLRGLMGRVRIETLAANVPDADRLDFSAPFASQLSMLAPGDHLHMPTREGMIRFLAGLGFAHRAVTPQLAMLIAVGATAPIDLPDAAAPAAVQTKFLTGLLAHANPYAAIGAASRLLADASPEALPGLRRRLRDDIEPGRILDRLASGERWDTLPFHLAPSSLALAVDCIRQGDNPGALAWLDVIEAAATRMQADHPVRALQSLDFRWASRFTRAQLLWQAEDFDGARVHLRTIIDSAADHVGGATGEQIARARATLAAGTRWPDWINRWHQRGSRVAAKLAHVARNPASYGRYWRGHLGYARGYVRYLRGYAGYLRRYMLLLAEARRRTLQYHAERLAGAAATARRRRVAALLQLPGRGVVVFRTAVARNRQSLVLTMTARACRKFLRAYDNRFNPDPTANGEALLLRNLARGAPIDIRDIAAPDGRFAAVAAGLDGVRQVDVSAADPAARRDILLRCGHLGKVSIDRPDAGTTSLVRIGPTTDLLATARRVAEGGAAVVVFRHGPEQLAAHCLLGDVVASLKAARFEVRHLLPNRLAPLPSDPAAFEDFGGRIFVAVAPGLAREKLSGIIQHLRPIGASRDPGS